MHAVWATATVVFGIDELAFALRSAEGLSDNDDFGGVR
jgi:hypothetical protein